MLQTIKAIIIDDEYNCIENLRYHINLHCSRIEICGTGTDYTELLHLCRQEKPHIAFLDIRLFDLNIMDVIHSVPSEVAIVFVTAYEVHALDAFRASALDYLVKPLEVNEVKRCYEKITHFIDGIHPQASITYPSRNIQLRSGEAVYIIPGSDILLLNAKGFYTEVLFFHKRTIKNVIISKPLSLTCADFDDVNIFRVHRSHAVNLCRIDHIIRSENGLLTIRIAGYNIPVSKSRRHEFKQKFHD